MATLCNVFIVAIGMSFLVGQVSYGHELLGDLNEGERQTCPAVIDCIGQVPCSSQAQCTLNKCCIDFANGMACCYQAAEPPTTSPSTANPTSDSPNPTTTVGGESPLCTYDYPTACGEACACTGQDDCYPGEVCCLEITTDGGVVELKLACHPTVEPTTKPPEGEKCPTENPPLECAPLPTGNCTTHGDCHNNQICCEVARGQPPCCVVYPPETVHN